MTWSELTVLVAGALLLLLWWVWVVASRLDRLHRKVATSRSALDNQLVRRASAAAELAAAGVLDPVSSVLVGEAAWRALSAGAFGRAELVAALPDLAALPELADLPDLAVAPEPGETLPGSGRSPGTLAGPDVEEQAVDRDLAESELSRTVRTALSDADELAALRADPAAGQLVDALAAAWYRVQLSRRFHNEAVAQTQRVRRKTLVRLLRLQGFAAMPRTVEVDDAWPEGFARPGEAR